MTNCTCGKTWILMYQFGYEWGSPDAVPRESAEAIVFAVCVCSTQCPRQGIWKIEVGNLLK